jgi:hypothetical protein
VLSGLKPQRDRVGPLEIACLLAQVAKARRMGQCNGMTSRFLP